MSITFYLQSKKNPAPIYVRIREGIEIDAKAKTNLSINPSNFKKGSIKLHKKMPGADANIKKEIQEKNRGLIKLQKELDDLKTSLTDLLNSRKSYETINSKWLNYILNPQQDTELPKDLASYFEFYLKNKQTSLQPSTIKKNRVFKHRVENFEKKHGVVYIQEVNKKFSRNFQEWCNNTGYDHNTIVKTLKMIKTVCNHARENGLATHPELEFIGKGMKYKKTEHIHLNLDELDRIAELNLDEEMDSERLKIARDWLVISCFTAQRVSDFLRFTKKDIRVSKERFYLQIKQKKTGKPVNLPILDKALEVLQKRNGNFPPIFSENVDSNASIYNSLIKDVCRIAKINEQVTVKRKNKVTNRYEYIQLAKHEAVSTHIGRRSFATNFYTQIPTPLLIAATGHSSEAQFLEYVGGTGDHNAIALSNAMEAYLESRKKEPKLEVIRNAVNHN